MQFYSTYLNGEKSLGKWFLSGELGNVSGGNVGGGTRNDAVPYIHKAEAVVVVVVVAQLVDWSLSTPQIRSSNLFLVSFSVFLSFQRLSVITGVKPVSSGVRIDHSANCPLTTALKVNISLFCKSAIWHFINICQLVIQCHVIWHYVILDYVILILLHSAFQLFFENHCTYLHPTLHCLYAQHWVRLCDDLPFYVSYYDI